MTSLLEGFDTRELGAIAEFLSRSTECAYRRAALLRAQLLMDYPVSSSRQDEAIATLRDEGGHGHG